jgi:hypothetical protein
MNQEDHRYHQELEIKRQQTACELSQRGVPAILGDDGSIRIGFLELPGEESPNGSSSATGQALQKEDGAELQRDGPESLGPL